jgi:hypothetical protein
MAGKKGSTNPFIGLNLLAVPLSQLESRPSGTGCAENTKITGSPSQDKDIQTASFLRSLLTGLGVSKTQQNPDKTSNRPVNRTLSLKGPPLQTRCN